MTKVNIADATEQQLRDFGRDTLGLNLPPNCKLATLRAKIDAAYDKDYITVAEATKDAEQMGQDPRPVTAEQAPAAPEKVRIIIQVQDEPGGNEPVPVSVNGKAMLIPRDEAVDIPVHFFEALKAAVAHRYEALPDGGINPTPREVPRYPFQVLSNAA